MNLLAETSPEAESSSGQGEACYRAIRADILHGRLAPKERLRIEPLRDSLRRKRQHAPRDAGRLSGEGLVIAEGHRGFVVAPVTRAEFRDLAALRALFEEHAMERSFAAATSNGRASSSARTTSSLGSRRR
jgi:DNA-binding GntR family transcriptional regulator